MLPVIHSVICRRRRKFGSTHTVSWILCRHGAAELTLSCSWSTSSVMVPISASKVSARARLSSRLLL